MTKPIFVTQPSMPPLEEFIPYLEKIWGNRVLTNGGPFHQQLEAALCEFLGVKHISLFANATIALITALQALEIRGEVITTPYSFVATAHSLKWNGIEPVFVDIEPLTLNLDPDRIEAAITEQTTAIMPVHCYGHPCDVDSIDRIARRHDLKVIYDAAHAFAVDCHCGSVLNHGDLSVLSFHATKVFNTFEGGAIVCQDAAMKKHIDNLKNFGFVNETTVTAAGINGKMNEVSSAFGLLQLKGVRQAIERRRQIDESYRRGLRDVKGVRCLDKTDELASNYSYFPVLIDNQYPLTRDALYQLLQTHGINTRRYFYPLISSFPMYNHSPSAAAGNLPVATVAADQVLCLPIYPALEEVDVQRIVGIVSSGR